MTPQEQSKCQVSLWEWQLKSIPKKCIMPPKARAKNGAWTQRWWENQKRRKPVFSLLRNQCCSPTIEIEWEIAVDEISCYFYQSFTAQSINNTSCIYKAFVFQHSTICIEPTQFENIYGIWPLFTKDEFHRKKVKIWAYLNIQHLRAIVQLCCFFVTDLTWGITMKSEANATYRKP